MKNGIIIITSILLGIALTVGGLFTTLRDFFSPSGNMFEGIVILSLGILTLLLIVVANALGKTITTFGQIMEKQAQLHDAIIKKPANSFNFPDLFGVPNMGTATIMDLNTGNVKTSNVNDISKNIQDILNEALNKNPNIQMGNVGLNIEPKETLEELERLLSEAVASDNFEKAEELKKKILMKKSSNGGGSESKDNKEE